MKVMTAKEAKNSFGVFIDTAQTEPVIVTRRKRPIGVFLSIQEIGRIPELKKNLLSIMDGTVKNPLFAMLGANKENPSFASSKEADHFISELRNEWTS